MTPYYLVDVFAANQYAGNPLAVFDDRAGQLGDKEMQQIAKEINYQETTFILGGSITDGFRVRIFTPEYEVPFAGHPTLGTAWVLANRLESSGTQLLTLHLNVGAVSVTWERETAWFEAKQPQFGPTFDRRDLASLLQLSKDNISGYEPIRLISTGLPYVLVPLMTLDGLRNVQLDAQAYEQWLLTHRLHKTNSTDGLTAGLYVFTDETYTPDAMLNARMFLLENGRVVEDYATGSAASCLLAHLLEQWGESEVAQTYLIEQGYEVGRPSLIYLSGNQQNGQYQLRVGGQVQYVARGEWG